MQAQLQAIQGDDALKLLRSCSPALQEIEALRTTQVVNKDSNVYTAAVADIRINLLALSAEEEEELAGSHLGIRVNCHTLVQVSQTWKLRNQGCNVSLQLCVGDCTISISVKAPHVNHLHHTSTAGHLRYV